MLRRHRAVAVATGSRQVVRQVGAADRSAGGVDGRCLPFERAIRRAESRSRRGGTLLSYRRGLRNTSHCGSCGSSPPNGVEARKSTSILPAV